MDNKLEISRAWAFFSWLTIWLLLVYLAIVSPLDSAVPAINRWHVAGGLLLVSGVCIYLVLRLLLHRHSNAVELIRNSGLLAFASLCSLLSADVFFTVYTNLNPSFLGQNQKETVSGRQYDKYVWDGELMPRIYYPARENFSLYKPQQKKTAWSFGQHYDELGLLELPLLRDSVLEKRRIEISIDRYGLRNLDDASSARIFVLGDSYVFGNHTDQGAIFSEVLSSQLGEPVYNMGVASTSPKQQLLLLEYFLRTYPDEFKPERLLWLIFEANDLEESYAEFLPAPPKAGALSPTAIFKGTMVGSIAQFPSLLRSQSVIRRLSDPTIIWTSSVASDTSDNHHLLDGRPLFYPLYFSPQFGYRMFVKNYLDRAGRPNSYVMEHPNLPRLNNTFHRMKALSEERGFELTVVIAPAPVRLYKDYFEDLPPVSEEPHFIRYVQQLAGETGFAHLDLNELMAPQASQELLYYRDDSHWNERGNEVVAKLLAQQLFDVDGDLRRAAPQ